MRTAVFLAIASISLYGAADTTTPKKTTPAPGAKSAAKSSSHRKTTAKAGQTSKNSKTSKTSKTSARRGKGSHSASASSWRSRQLAPTPDRYKEIQSALVQRGYLKKDPSGVWDAESADAMRHFQKDQSLEASGKLNSLSLIALGLGPKHTAPAPAAPRVPVPQTPVMAPPSGTAPAPAPESPGPTPAAPPTPSTQL